MQGDIIANTWHVCPILFHTHSLCSDYHLAMKTSPPSDVTCVSNRSSKSTVVDDQGGESTNSECEYDTNHEQEDDNSFQCSSIPAPANTHSNKLAMLGNMYATPVALKVGVAPKSNYYTHPSNVSLITHTHILSIF